MNVKQMTRIVSLLLTVFICLGLAACGKKEDAASSSTAQTTQQITATAGGTITMPEGFEAATPWQQSSVKT